MDEENKILLQNEFDGIYKLTLNRPRAHNALSYDLLLEISNALNTIKKNKRIKVLIIDANGPSFCSGHDLKEINSKNDKASYKKLFNLCSSVMLSIIKLDIPVIASVHSTATAAGCQLVATCDLAIASDKARFATPGVNIGLFCSTPMVALSRNISKKHSMEMLLTGDLIDALTAKEYGLINRVVPHRDLNDTVLEIAKKILKKSSKTIATGKKAFYEQLELGVSEAYKFTSEIMTKNMTEYNAQEGVDAFLQKRSPIWKD